MYELVDGKIRFTHNELVENNCPCPYYPIKNESSSCTIHDIKNHINVIGNILCPKCNNIILTVSFKYTVGGYCKCGVRVEMNSVHIIMWEN